MTTPIMPVPDDRIPKAPKMPWQMAHPFDDPESEPVNPLSRLFGGGDPIMSGLLSRTQSNKLGPQALIDAGLAIIQASGPQANHVKPGLFQALATGLSSGRNSYQQGAASAIQTGELAKQKDLEARRQQIMSKYAGRSDLHSMQGMLSDLISIGDYKGAQPLAGYLANAVNQEGGTILPVKLANGQVVLVNKHTGEQLDTLGGPSDKPPMTPYQTSSLDLMRHRAASMDTDRIIGDFDRQTKDMTEAATSYGVLQDALSNPTEASTVPILDMFARIYNPKLAVRVGTLQVLGQKLGTLGQRLEGYYTGKVKGQLPPDLRAAMLKQVQQSMRQYNREFQKVRGRSLYRGKKLGIDDIDQLLNNPFSDYPELTGASDNTKSSLEDFDPGE